MRAKVQKWGDSLAVRIPSSLAKETRLSSGSSVDLSVRDGKILIQPHAGRGTTLDELLGGITRQNIHPEVETGDAVGREAW